MKHKPAQHPMRDKLEQSLAESKRTEQRLTDEIRVLEKQIDAGKDALRETIREIKAMEAELYSIRLLDDAQ